MRRLVRLGLGCPIEAKRVHHPSSVHGNPAGLKAAATKAKLAAVESFSSSIRILGDSDTRAAERKGSIRNGKRLVSGCGSPEMGIFGYVNFEYESGRNPARGLLRKRKRERMSAVVRISTYSILTWGGSPWLITNLQSRRAVW